MLSVEQFSMLLAIAGMLHVTEEFLFPGGFIEWYRELMPPKTKGRGPAFLVWINTLMMWFIALALYYGNTSTGASIALAVASALAINGIFHIYGLLKLRKYSPGVVTGTFLYLPLIVIGAYCFWQSRLVTPAQLGIYLAIAIVYHFISARKQAG